MTRLTVFGKAWRNYLFANNEAIHNIAEDFRIRVELINDVKEELANNMLSEEPNQDVIESCREEVEYQKANLQDTIQAFASYFNENMEEAELADPSALVDEICKEGKDSYFYTIADEWQSWVEKVQKIWGILNEKYDYDLYFIQDDLRKLVMDEIYGYPIYGKNKELILGESSHKEKDSSILREIMQETQPRMKESSL